MEKLEDFTLTSTDSDSGLIEEIVCKGNQFDHVAISNCD